jgi:hypothetical protein
MDVLTEDVYPIRGRVVAGRPSGRPDEMQVDVALSSNSKWMPLGPVATSALTVSAPGKALAQVLTRAAELLPFPGGAARVRITCRVATLMVGEVGCPEDPLAALEEVLVPGAEVMITGPPVEENSPIKPPSEQTPLELLDTLQWFNVAWFDTQPDDFERGGGGGDPVPRRPALEDVRDDDDRGGGDDRDDDGDRDDDPPLGVPLTCFDVVSVGITAPNGAGGGARPLSDTSSVGQVEDAMKVFLQLVTAMDAACVPLGILGDLTPQAIARTKAWRKAHMLFITSAGACLQLINVKAVQAADFDPSRVNFAGYSVMGKATAKGGAVRGDISLIDRLLQAAAGQQLRHVNDTVYAEQVVPRDRALVWAKAMCAFPNCSVAHSHVMYGDPTAVPDTGARWCPEHAAERMRLGQPVANMVFVTAAASIRVAAEGSVRRTWSAAKPRFLVGTKNRSRPLGTKTWMPRMPYRGGASSFAEKLGGTSPETVADFVQNVLDVRLTNRVVWEEFHAHPATRTALINALKHTRDEAFPVHMPRKELFAFANGMLSIEERVFHTFDALPQSWAAHGAINYIDEFFDPLWLVQPLDTLAVPGYDDILDTQKYEPETRNMLDALLGRLFFPLRELEFSDVAPILLGTAASGKSTIAKAVMAIVREAEVGLLPSNCEPNYPLAGCINKRMVVCTEMREDFRLPIPVLLQMISADPVTIHAKYKDPIETATGWRVPTMLIGNVIPASFYNDAQGALKRRVVVFRLDIKPSTQDPTVQLRFMENLGPFLVRTVRQYCELAKKLNNTELKHMFNTQMKNFQAAFVSETSTSAAFLDHMLSVFTVGMSSGAAVGSGGSRGAAATDSHLMELFRYLQDAVRAGAAAQPAGPGPGQDGAAGPVVPTSRFPGISFNQEDIGRAVAAAEPQRYFTAAAYDDLVREYRVPRHELEAMYKAWWMDNRPTASDAGGKPSRTAPKFQLILGELGLPTSTDTDDPSPSTVWVFGVKRAGGGPPRGPDDDD